MSANVHASGLIFAAAWLVLHSMLYAALAVAQAAQHSIAAVTRSSGCGEHALFFAESSQLLAILVRSRAAQGDSASFLCRGLD